MKTKKESESWRPVRIESETHRRLRVYAAKRDENISDLADKAVRAYLARREAVDSGLIGSQAG